MTTSTPIDLSAPTKRAVANAGDDIYLPFTVDATDTTNWTVTFVWYLANETGTGKSGATIGSGSVVNTPNTGGGASSLAVTTLAAVTSGKGGQTIWGEMIKTNSGSRRTLANIALELRGAN